MPLFGNVLRNIRRSADELLTGKGSIQATFAIDGDGEGQVFLEEGEMGDFLKAIKAYRVEEDGESSESPAEVFRRTVVTHDGSVSFKTKEGFEVDVPAKEWNDFIEGVSEVNDLLAAARRRLDAGEQPTPASRRSPKGAIAPAPAPTKRTRAPIPKHELAAFTDDEKEKVLALLPEETGATNISAVHRAALTAGVFQDPSGTSGLAHAQKAVLRQFLSADERVGKNDSPGERGPEAAKWFRRADATPPSEGKHKRR